MTPGKAYLACRCNKENLKTRIYQMKHCPPYEQLCMEELDGIWTVVCSSQEIRPTGRSTMLCSVQYGIEQTHWLLVLWPSSFPGHQRHKEKSQSHFPTGKFHVVLYRTIYPNPGLFRMMTAALRLEKGPKLFIMVSLQYYRYCKDIVGNCRQDSPLLVPI